MATPIIIDITPDHGSASGGTILTLDGANFEAVRGSGTVTVGGTEVTGYNSWSDTQVVVTTPAGTDNGTIIVTNNSSESSAPEFYASSFEALCTDGVFRDGDDALFTEVCTDGVYAQNVFIFDVNLDKPTITDISPRFGIEEGGDTVTITGSNFEAVQGTGTVYFGGVEVEDYVSWSDDEIVVISPVGVGSVAVVVTNDAGFSSPNGFYEASITSICTDGIFRDDEEGWWTEVMTDGIFTSNTFTYNSRFGKLIRCSKLKFDLGVGHLYN